MAEVPRADPYAGIITLSDLNNFQRGWDSFESHTGTIISRCTARQVVPSNIKEMLPASSRTLSRQQSDAASPLPPDVQLQITGNSVLSQAIKFISPLIDPIPFSIEQNALVCTQRKVSPDATIMATISYADVQGITSTQMTPGLEYSMKPPTATAISRGSPKFEFKNNGVIEQRSTASTVIVSTAVQQTRKAEAQELIRRITAQSVIAQVSVNPIPLSTVFPAKKAKSEQDRNVSIDHTGIKITGTIDGKTAILELKCEDASNGCDNYKFFMLPSQTVTGMLLMTGLSPLGRSMSAGGIAGVVLTFYDQVDHCYYMGITVQFSRVSSGSIYLPIIPVQTAGLPPAMPPSVSRLLVLPDAGDRAMVSPSLIQAGVSNVQDEDAAEDYEEEDVVVERPVQASHGNMIDLGDDDEDDTEYH